VTAPFPEWLLAQMDKIEQQEQNAQALNNLKPGETVSFPIVFGELPTAPVRECGHRPLSNTSAVPCMLTSGHRGSHWSTSGCAGGEMTWAHE
jgi:hypothetical protein